MKLIFLRLILFAVYFSNSSQFPSKIPESACKIISEVLEKENWMKTVAIVKFSHSFDDEVIDNLMKCLTVEITVVLIDIGSFNSEGLSLQNPTFIVIIIDKPTELIVVG